jgi:hypothetical protein
MTDSRPSIVSTVPPATMRSARRDSFVFSEVAPAGDSESEDLAEGVFDSLKILVRELSESAADDSLVDGHDLRSTGGTGVTQSCNFPSTQGLITRTRPLEIPGSAADGTHNDVGKASVEELRTHDQRRTPP